MTKMLVALAGFLGLTSACTPILNSQAFSTKSQLSRPPKDWNMSNHSLEQEMGPGESLKFFVTKVDFTVLGISSQYDIQAYYRDLIIPELSIKYNDQERVTEDVYTWLTKDLEYGPNEHWSNVFNKYDEALKATIVLDRSYYYTHSVVDRHLIIRLTYRASILVENPSGNLGGKISFQSGTYVRLE